MDEWGIALVGLVGALIGAGIGFIGVVWQHRAERWSRIREKGADLIFLGEQVKNNYRVTRIPNSLARNTGFTSPDPSKWIDQMQAILRYLELAAPRRIFVFATYYTSNTKELLLMDDEHDAESIAHASKSMQLWSNSRVRLSYHLRNPRRTPLQVLRGLWESRRRR